MDGPVDLGSSVVESFSAGGAKTSQISDFFDGTSVFITGASGFVGTVLLETLLRCCPGLKTVYILLREKKGVPSVQRKQQILQKKVFAKLKCSNPKVFEKIYVIDGDVVQDDLNIPTELMTRLEEEVFVIFHCAAVISFLKNLRDIIFPNLIGTDNVLKFSRKLINLKAFVHCSTAFSNCHRRDGTEEKVNRMTISSREFIETTRHGDEKALQKLVDQCDSSFPTTYTFAKALAEDLILNEASDLPVSIVRPSTIVHAWKGSTPGYVEEGSGLIDISIGVGKGFIRVVYCKPDNIIDIVPVDVVANAMITSAWYLGTRQLESSQPLVVNCSGSEFFPMTWGEIITQLYQMNKDNPLPKMYQKPHLTIRENRITYWANAMLDHYAPALCIDAMLLLMKKKPILTRMYRFYDRVMYPMLHFVENQWLFKCDNLKILTSAMNESDSELFPMNMEKIDKKDYFYSLLTGGPFYEWARDKRTYEDRMSVAERRYMLTTLLKWMTVFCFLSFAVLVIFNSKLR